MCNLYNFHEKIYLSFHGLALFVLHSGVFCILFCLSSSSAYTDEIELEHPCYHIEISQHDLDALNKDPYSDEYYPATCIYKDFVIQCEVRFRGATSRNYPKKSWKIKFQDEQNVFHAEEINLNADYNDMSCMRNYFACKLFDFFDYPAPDVSYVNLFVNDDYSGLYLQVEQIDECFLARNGRESGSLYKAINHGANMAPLSNDSMYDMTYEKKMGDFDYYQDIKLLFSKAKYWSETDFATKIGQEIDVEKYLLFYAILFSITSNDNYVKNYYLYSNPETGQFEMFPWDNDASFGNNWEGNFYDVYETFLAGSYLDNNTLFRRLMNNTEWRAVYWDYVYSIADEGFPYLENLLSEKFDDIRHDTYLDNNKKGTNEDFDDSVVLLQKYLSKRAEFLKNATGKFPVTLSDFTCSNPFPHDDERTVVFTVRSEKPQNIACVYTDDLDFMNFGDSYSEKKLPLYDDGEHNDNEADDLIYGNSLTIPGDFKGLIPYTFSAERYSFPENGLFYINRIRTHSFALNCRNENIDSLCDLGIGNVYMANGEYFIEVVNNSNDRLDISCCYLQIGEDFQNTIFPEGTIISPKDYIVVATDSVLASTLFEKTSLSGNTCFAPDYGKSLKLLAPDLSVMYEKTCDEIKSFEGSQARIIINEVNYNSSDDFNTDDWVELYNTEEYPVNISGWVFQDGDDSHKYVFPLETIIDSKEYIVMVRDRESFKRFFPSIDILTNELDFGFSGSGESLRLFDQAGSLIDSLTYDDESPWPEKPDGEGASLSLKHPSLDNGLGKNWTASQSHGTPGRVNDVTSTDIPEIINILSNYPNPFNKSTTITFSITHENRVKVEIFNTTGQYVLTLLNEDLFPGTHTVAFNGDDCPSGLYFYRIKSNSTSKTGKMMMLK